MNSQQFLSERNVHYIRPYHHRKVITTVKYGYRTLSRWMWVCDLKYKKIFSIRIYFPQNNEFLVNEFLSQKCNGRMRTIFISNGKKPIRRKDQLKLPKQLRKGATGQYFRRDYLNELLWHTLSILYRYNIHKFPMTHSCYEMLRRL